MLPAMVLAAGLGTRLRPLTDLRAKALVPLGDGPALAQVVGRLRRAGVPRIVVNAHHHASEVEAYARAQGLGVSREDELLGTAGGVAGAAELLGGGDVVVWNADIVADVDAAAVAAAHGEGSREATLVLRRRPMGEGAVGVDRVGRVVRLRTERTGEEHVGADFLGVSVLAASLRAVLPSRGGLVEDAWLPAMRAGKVVHAFWFEGVFFDIGSVHGYLAANRAWLAARGASRWVGPGATVAEGVSLVATVVGEGAVCAGTGALARCVVWPGARAVAPLADAVVMP